MSTTQAQPISSESAEQSSIESPTQSLSEKAQQLESHLCSIAREKGGSAYVKSKFISDDVGLSPKEIGALMLQVRDDSTLVEVEKWSYTSSTTWLIKC